ncbi:MAG: conjugal transfer protein TraR [Chloroflexi bacterium]|nr:conjugal transfer protein TraR [Chloroflexota bacterium]
MDDADRADVIAALTLQAQIKAARRDIDPGVPGDCDTCGQPSGRLIGGQCAWCRELDEERCKRR